MKNRRLFTVILFSILSSSKPSLGEPRLNLEDFWVPDVSVSAAALSPGGDLLYLGGNFTYVGPPTGAWTALDPTSGEPVLPYPHVSGGAVLAAEPDGQGGWYLGGSFNKVAGVPRLRLAHIRSDGSLGDWNP